MQERGEVSAVTLLILVLLGGVGIYLGISYNFLVKQVKLIDYNWIKLETKYQERRVLMPKLITAIKDDDSFDDSLESDVIDAEAKCITNPISIDLIDNSRDFANFQHAENELDVALSKLISSNKDDSITESQQKLFNTVTLLSEQINIAKQEYNKVVQIYNPAINKFPQSILAKTFNFSPKAVFESSTSSNILSEDGFIY